MRTDLSWWDLVWRFDVIVLAAISASLGAPTALSTVFFAAAAAAVIDSAVRARTGWWPETVLVVVGVVLLGFVGLGLLLNLLPSGLDRVPWAIGAALVGAASVTRSWLVRRARSASIADGSPREQPRIRSRNALLNVGWYVAAAGAVAVAIAISEHATDVANRPPMQVSVVGRAADTVQVQVAAGREHGRFELSLTSDSGPARIARSFDLDRGERTRFAVTIPAGTRVVVGVRRAGTTVPVKSVIVTAAATSSPDPDSTTPSSEQPTSVRSP